MWSPCQLKEECNFVRFLHFVNRYLTFQHALASTLNTCVILLVFLSINKSIYKFDDFYFYSSKSNLCYCHLRHTHKKESLHWLTQIWALWVKKKLSRQQWRECYRRSFLYWTLCRLNWRRWRLWGWQRPRFISCFRLRRVLPPPSWSISRPYLFRWGILDSSILTSLVHPRLQDFNMDGSFH